MTRVVAILLGLLAAKCSVAREKEVLQSAVRHEVDEVALDLFDEARQRDVPIRVYHPRSGGAHPVVLFSHGLGESRDSYRYIGEGLARHGFVAIHITHRGSDRDFRKRHGLLALHRATREPATWANRPLDVAFVLDLLERRDERLRRIVERCDLARVAIAGHSAGAFTSLAMAGAVVKGDVRVRHRRIRAAVAMSLPKLDTVFLEGAYDELSIPVLHMTGTRDRSLFYWTFPRDRRDPWERSRGPNHYLVTFRGVSHWTFSNVARPDDQRELRMQSLIVTAMTSFLDAHLNGSESARAWLVNELPAIDATRVEIK